MRQAMAGVHHHVGQLWKRKILPAPLAECSGQCRIGRKRGTTLARVEEDRGLRWAYLLGTLHFAPTRWVFAGCRHCWLICAHCVSRRGGYVGYIRKALEKGYLEHPGSACCTDDMFEPVLLAASFRQQAATMSVYKFTPRAVASPNAPQKPLVWHFLTDFKKYTHTPPPLERKFGATDQKSRKPTKSAKTHRVCTF